MTRQELIKSMSASVNGAGFISVTELCIFLGLKNKSRVKRDFCSGLDRVGKAFFIPDVAEKIMEKRGNL